MNKDKKKLLYLEYVNRENSFVHQTLNEEILQYIYLKNGDERCIEEAARNFDPDIQGRISLNDLRNIKYLFVAATTLACRYSIEGGVEQKKAFSISDMFIRQMDLLKDVDSVVSLHAEMFKYYFNEISLQNKKKINSLQISKSIDYIYDHLNEKICIEDLANHVKLHPNYLSNLFKKETGMTIIDFIQEKKVETACNMLTYTEYSNIEISTILGFSSQSYFIQIFKKIKGITPSEYRKTSLNYVT